MQVIKMQTKSITNQVKREEKGNQRIMKKATRRFESKILEKEFEALLIEELNFFELLMFLAFDMF